MKWWLISLTLLVTLVSLEAVLPLKESLNRAFWPIERYFISIRGWTDSVGSCAANSGKPEKKVLQISQVSRVNSGKLLIKGKSDKGDLVLDRFGRVVGRVEKSWDGWTLVDTPISDRFKMVVTVQGNGFEVDGRLLGGDPPLVSVPEDLNLKGATVLISKSENFGAYVRSVACGEIGKILDRKGDFWVMEPTASYKGLVVVGK